MEKPRLSNLPEVAKLQSVTPNILTQEVYLIQKLILTLTRTAIPPHQHENLGQCHTSHSLACILSL